MIRIDTMKNKLGEEYEMHYINIASDKNPIWQWDGIEDGLVECDTKNDECISTIIE